MRRSDVSPDRQTYLVKCDDHPHCHALIPPPTPRRLPASASLGGALQEAHQALGELAMFARLLPNADMVTRTLVRREAVQSSLIEGTRTQLHELLEYEATGGLDGLPPDASITERYVEALELGLSTYRATGSRMALNNDLIRAMHRILMQDAPPGYRPGEYRDTQAWIGQGPRIEDATFVPPPPREIARCMDELEASMLQYAPHEEEFGELSIIAQVALAHAQFETIHPFTDGNGRVGRLLMPLMLASEGYPPLYLSGYLLRHRRAYYDALAGVQLRGEWAEWVVFLCHAIVDACRVSIAIAQDLSDIHARWMYALKDLRSDAAARKMPLLLLGHPVITVRQVAGLLAISFPTANKGIELLVSRGILSEPDRRRNRLFHAVEVLERLRRE